jgi:hypothetical protein
LTGLVDAEAEKEYDILGLNLPIELGDGNFPVSNRNPGTDVKRCLACYRYFKFFYLIFPFFFFSFFLYLL